MAETNCPDCGGPLESTVLSGVVSLKRRRAVLASGRVSAINGMTCVRCGRTLFYAADPKRLFPEWYKDAGKGKGKDAG